VSGPKVVNKFPDFVAERERLIARAMTQALILGASEASVMTPIDTSTLINSQYRKVEKTDSGILGSVGYTAGYAKYVHDPEHKQNFRRATAQKEFLSKGFEKAAANIQAVLVGALRV